MENLKGAKIDALFKVLVTRLYPKNALSWDDSCEMAGCRCEVFKVIKGLFFYQMVIFPVSVT